MRKKKENRSSVQDCQYYSFQNFSQAAQLGAFLAPFFEGESSLYKDSFSNNYYMILRKTQSENNTFHRACNIAADFGVRISASYATPAYLGSILRRYWRRMQLRCWGNWLRFEMTYK